MTAAGRNAALIGPDDELLGRIGTYVELHIEQGKALAGLGAAVGIGAGIWPHGRWRLDFTGRADHAGTTRLADRRDPMLPYAATALAARDIAADCGALATFGKVVAEPGAANAICSAVSAWLDARAADEATLDHVVSRIGDAARDASARHGTAFEARRESFTSAVSFDGALIDRMAAVLATDAAPPPVLPTGAGHDAGILAARVPAGMLFVRNPTGVSHSPAERAERGDCESGVAALAAVLADLAAA
jgi:beta-ureidopropionase / N-carbamoyl-L-amino-acid hydrolase